jgi:hypothetical protein
MIVGAQVPSFRTGQKAPPAREQGGEATVAGPTPNTNHIIGLEVEKLI